MTWPLRDLATLSPCQPTERRRIRAIFPADEQEERKKGGKRMFAALAHETPFETPSYDLFLDITADNILSLFETHGNGVSADNQVLLL